MPMIGVPPIEEDERSLVTPLSAEAMWLPGAGEVELRVRLPAGKWPLQEDGMELTAFACGHSVTIHLPRA